MKELGFCSDNVMPEPEVVIDRINSKCRVIRLLNRDILKLVGFKKNDLQAIQYHQALGTLLSLLIGDLAIDRTDIELQASSGIDWIDARIAENVSLGKGVALREGVEFFRKGDTPNDLLDAIRVYWDEQRRFSGYCSRVHSDQTPPIRIHAFNDDTFHLYGRSLALEDSQVLAEVLTAERFYTGRVAVVADGETWELGRLVADNRNGGNYYATQCDAHKLTDEVLVPDCDCFLTVAPYRTPEPDANGRLSLDFFRGDVFLVRRGQPVMVNKGIAHTAPTRLGYGGALTTPVLFRKGTTDGGQRDRDIELSYFRSQRLYLKI